MATIPWAKDVSGNFNTAADWTGNAVPGSPDEAFLHAAGGAAYTVTLDTGNTRTGGITVGSIRSDANATLFLDNAGENNGTVDVLYTNLDTNGTIDDTGYGIEASGTIKGSLIVDAGGIIDAGYSAALTIDTRATVVNDGDFEGMGGGGLIIRATTVNDNGGGEIGGAVTLDGADIEGGTLYGHTIQVRGSGNAFDGSTDAITSDADVTVMAGASLTGEGQINNEGADQRRFVVKGTASLEAVDNTGILENAGGTLTVQGALSGGGNVVIHGGTVTLASSVAAKVGFQGSGELVLGEAENFSGTIQNFATNGDTSLDLADVGFAGATEATFSGDSKGGVLTVVGANQTVQFELKGDYLGVTFTAASADGGAASVITASTTSDAVARFAQAAAAFAPTPGPTPLSTVADTSGTSAMLALATPALTRR